MSKQCPKTTRRRLCCEKLGTSHDLKNFAIGSFLDGIVERVNGYLCLQKRQKYWSDYCKTDRFLAKFAQKIPTKSDVF